MPQGSYMQSVATHRKRAIVAKYIMELHGYGWIVKEIVRPRYANFAKANGKAFDHNADGLALALETLKQYDAQLAQDIEFVLDVRR